MEEEGDIRDLIQKKKIEAKRLELSISEDDSFDDNGN